MIKESPVNLECKVTEVRELGSHDMFMAEIVKVHVDDKIIDEDGHFDVVGAGLLAYIHGHYYGIRRKASRTLRLLSYEAQDQKRLQKEAHEKRVERTEKTKQIKKDCSLLQSFRYCLFDVLYLFSDLFDLCLYVQHIVCDLQIVSLGADGVGFAVHFLDQEVKFFADS